MSYKYPAPRSKYGKFTKMRRCDACGGPCNENDAYTDYEAMDAGGIDGSDGPGFRVCNRKRCKKYRESLAPLPRFEMYVSRRAENDALDLEETHNDFPR